MYNAALNGSSNTIMSVLLSYFFSPAAPVTHETYPLAEFSNLFLLLLVHNYRASDADNQCRTAFCTFIDGGYTLILVSTCGIQELITHHTLSSCMCCTPYVRNIIDDGSVSAPLPPGTFKLSYQALYNRYQSNS